MRERERKEENRREGQRENYQGRKEGREGGKNEEEKRKEGIERHFKEESKKEGQKEEKKSFILTITYLTNVKGFPVGSMVNNPPANAGYRALIPGSGRSPGEGNGNLSSSLRGHKSVGHNLVA